MPQEMLLQRLRWGPAGRGAWITESIAAWTWPPRRVIMGNNLKVMGRLQGLGWTHTAPAFKNEEREITDQPAQLWEGSGKKSSTS